ncbi:hypothetical protein Pla108_28360 [Botrimarina colliarenosi]|uniref:Uncharacterized protein n=1 Tax=Botrimarina colliarenosi TaxID=2528001 RepID=A0A5C6ABU3_9BACT|nr:hypothetical protein [Botrimarina colliarenosi]TWT97059.1 hypothetical protein Pla108_28360 [Botrimarina colliarenosi]
MLPDIKISLPVLFVLWCAGGYWAMNGPVMLAYPAMWLGVAVLFLVVSKAVGGASKDAK